MADNKSIKIGSVIHLENGWSDGGYLDVRGSVKDTPVFKVYRDYQVHGLVSTHKSANRRAGSGSWEILSADGKKSEGDDVVVGDKIYLRSLHADRGYLDTFEWVRNLQPFRDYPMTIGVFTAAAAKRGGGLTGTWEIMSATKKAGETLAAGDKIYLKNEYPGAGFLYTYGKKMVTDHPLFQDYAGQKRFVFTDPDENETHGSRTWTVMLSQYTVTRLREAESIYRLRDKLNGEWVHFELGSYEGQPLIALALFSENNGLSLQGTATYKEKEPMPIAADWTESGGYQVKTDLDGRSLNVTWKFGGKKISSLSFEPTDTDYRRIEGGITYVGQTAVRFEAMRTATVLQHDFYKSALWQTRIDRISGALEAAVDEFDQVLFSLNEASITGLCQIIDGAGGESYHYLQKAAESIEKPKVKARFEKRLNKIRRKLTDPQEDNAGTDNQFTHLNEKLAGWLQQSKPKLPLKTDTSENTADFEYQAKQLLNIYTLWTGMKEFWASFKEKAIDYIQEYEGAYTLPSVHLIRSSFRQFTIDFEIIQRAVQQRRWRKAAGATPATNAQARTLVVTDKLAAMALAPFQHLISEAGSHPIIPITYFSERIYIRQLPYTGQFVWVGLTYDLISPTPFTSPEDTSSPLFELLAIPHEVGHFMYHHAKLGSGEDEENTFAAMGEETFATHPYRHWCEEIFSDLYGCVVAGPLAVLGLQELLATGDSSRVLMDDEHHPTPLLRPYFLSEMLRILSKENSKDYNFSDVAQILDTNWTAILERWGFVTEFLEDHHSRPIRIIPPTKDKPKDHWHRYINVDDAIENVQEIITPFARKLLESRKEDQAKVIPWGKKQGKISELIEEINRLTDPRVIDTKITTSHNLIPKVDFNLSLSHGHTDHGHADHGHADHDHAPSNQQIFSGFDEWFRDAWTDSGPVAKGEQDNITSPDQEKTSTQKS